MKKRSSKGLNGIRASTVEVPDEMGRGDRDEQAAATT
jgi:hypothetical protein